MVQGTTASLKCENEISSSKQKFSERFKMTELGTLKHYLGITVERNKTNLMLSQRKYLEGIL